jgi:hypothetical protein
MDLTPRRQSVSQVTAHAPRLEKVKQEFKQKSTSRLEPKGNWGLVNNDTKQESTPMPRRQPAPQEAVRNPRDNIPPRRQSQGFKKKPVLRLKPEGNWSIVRSITALLFSLIAAKAIETNAVNLENKEISCHTSRGLTSIQLVSTKKQWSWLIIVTEARSRRLSFSFHHNSGETQNPKKTSSKERLSSCRGRKSTKCLSTKSPSPSKGAFATSLISSIKTF